MRAVLVGLSLLGSGCVTTWMKAAPDTPQPKPSKAMLAGFVVHFGEPGGSVEKDKSLLSAAVDAAQNAGLDDFGKKATEQLKSALAARGYEVTFDHERAKILDSIEIASNAGTAALTGQWRHPETSAFRPQWVDTLFSKPPDVIRKLRNAEPKEYYAFADVGIYDAGMIMKEPHLYVRAVVYDQDAKLVLDLQGLGEGDSTFFLSNRSPENLDKALAKAFESLKTVKEETL